MNILNLFKKKNVSISDLTIEQLANSKIWFLAIGINGTPSLPVECNDESLLIVSKYRKPVLELSDEDSIFPFNMMNSGIQILPAFRELEGLKKFCKNANIPKLDHLFEPISLKGGFLGQFAEDIFTVILDPFTAQELSLNKQQLHFMRSISKND